MTGGKIWEGIVFPDSFESLPLRKKIAVIQSNHYRRSVLELQPESHQQAETVPTG